MAGRQTGSRKKMVPARLRDNAADISSALAPKVSMKSKLIVSQNNYGIDIYVP